MTRFSRGDVILALFPNSDLKTYKRRPALIVQSDEVETELDQYIVTLITSNLRRKGPSRVEFLSDSMAGKQMGLLTDSVVVTDNLSTILSRHIDRAIGHCAQMSQVDEALKTTLGL